jgi:hypothetical protein
MRVTSLVSLGLMPTAIIAQDVFEPADFNVTEALLDNGVNVSAIPELSGLGARSLLSGCAITVSYQQSLVFRRGGYKNTRK